MALIDEATFELVYTHRDVSTSPGSTQFTQLIKKYTAKINGYLGVSSDICAVGDDSHEEEVIVDIIGDLIEGHLVVLDDYNRTPLSERGELVFPQLTQDHKTALDQLKGQDETIEGPAFNFDTTTTEGGYNF